MVFQSILREVTAAVDGAIGAIFADHQGEAVETFSEVLSPYELQVIGAYQGIFLRQLEAACARVDGTRPERFKMSWKDVTMLNTLLPDGYYLVLLLGPSANEGLAWHQLVTCCEQIVKEM